MRTRQPAASPLYPKIRFAFTDHPTTVKAGVSYSPYTSNWLFVPLPGPRDAILWQFFEFIENS